MSLKLVLTFLLFSKCSSAIKDNEADMKNSASSHTGFKPIK